MASSPLAAAVFVAATALSLSASVVLVVRLERVGARLGLSEALLGLLAALAADTPEITSAVTALSRGQASVGAGVIIGSNVFNLAALLGLAAAVAGFAAGELCARLGRALDARREERFSFPIAGGMLVTVEVMVPQNLNGKARSAIEDLREATAGADPREELLERAKET